MSTARKTKSSEQTVAERVAELFESSESITAQQLADFCERDAKTVRAYLRKINSRDQSQFKNAQYSINAELAQTVAEHFSTAKRMTQAQ